MFGLTLWQVWGHVWHFLCVDVCPVEVIVGILLVVALREAFIKRAASCKETHIKVSSPRTISNN